MSTELKNSTAEIAASDRPGNMWTWACSWFHWKSETMLRNAEKKILSYLKTSYRGQFIDIGSCVGTNDKVWTISMNTESKQVPLVLLHGLGAACGLWLLNLDTFARSRPVYAMDILGFGRSSRPNFGKEASEVEAQFVSSIEEWRREMNLKEMILCGHSMGGYLATSYAIMHPDRVKHLILADPWGFPHKPNDVSKSKKGKYDLLIRTVAFVLQPWNPLWMLRAAGPFGQSLISNFRPDLVNKFSPIIADHNVLPEYIHQCNARTPSGESAFHAMMFNFGWAKNPMIARIHTLHKDIPITILRGSRSWVSEIRLARIGYVNTLEITGAGHHVYADKPDVFNKCVLDACEYSDSTKPAAGNSATEADPEEQDSGGGGGVVSGREGN